MHDQKNQHIIYCDNSGKDLKRDVLPTKNLLSSICNWCFGLTLYLVNISEELWTPKFREGPVKLI